MTKRGNSMLRFILIPALSMGISPQGRARDDYLDAAMEVAKWLQSVGRDTEEGRVWPIDPEKPDEVVTHLYSGNAGVVLFFLEAYHVTQRRELLSEAQKGGDYLLATLPQRLNGDQVGLYTGTAGVGFALIETFKATGDDRYRRGALRTIELLSEAGKPSGAGIAWNDTTDIIAGSAGIGLFLLYAARELEHPPAKELAIRAGRHLLEEGIEEAQGVKWAMSPSYPRLMPNFSHGTAGVAYFLATLYAGTEERAFLEAALAGGRYLRSIADTTNDACLIFHHEPDGKDLFYLGWCHGPPGTARLFYRLWTLTRDPVWMEWTAKCARAILESGIPEKNTPGFWVNHGQCCGTAGVAEFIWNMHRITKDPVYLAYAKRATGHILSEAIRDEKGMRWLHAEHRIQPDLLQAQTGYMQGAAGIGHWLLRFHEATRGKQTTIILPDSPF
jgi:lantibiotic modifying enzyme